MDTQNQVVQAASSESVKTKFCKFCGQKINENAVICPLCGCQVEEMKSKEAPMPQITITNTNSNVNSNTNQNNNTGNGFGVGAKNKWTAFFLCLFLGYLGAHKFYEGKTGTGLIYIFTLGLFGIGWMLDCLILLLKPNPYYVR